MKSESEFEKNKESESEFERYLSNCAHHVERFGVLVRQGFLRLGDFGVQKRFQHHRLCRTVLKYVIVVVFTLNLRDKKMSVDAEVAFYLGCEHCARVYLAIFGRGEVNWLNQIMCDTGMRRKCEAASKSVVGFEASGG